MTRPLSQTQPVFDTRLKELARNVGELRREVRSLPTSSGGSSAWGGITGTLSAQTDLQAALDAKAAASHSHIIANVTGLQTALDGKQPLATVLTNTTASFTTAQETKLAGIATGATANVGTVTSVGGTGTVSGLTLSGSVTVSGNLTLGGTLAVTPANFASQTQNTFLAAPNGSSGTPTFRAIVAADVPTLNQSTTGSAATLTTGRTIGMTGDVTWTSASFNGSGNVTGTSTIGNNVVSLAKMATVASGTFLGRVTASTGNVEALTGTQATTLLDTFTTSLKGVVPASGGGTSNFLRADGTWAAPAGGGGGVDIADPQVAQTYYDDFVGGSAETGEIGLLGWSFTNGSITNLNGIQSHPGVKRLNGSATANQVCSFYLMNAVGDTLFRFDEWDEATFIFKEAAAAQTDMTLQIGVLTAFGNVTVTHGCYLEIKPADSNYFVVTRNGGAETRTDTGVARGTNWIKVKMRRVSSTDVRFNINGGADITHTTNIPDAADSLGIGKQSAQTGTTARNIDIDFVSFKMLAITR